MQRNEKDAATRSTQVEGRATSLSGSSGQPPLATGDIRSARDGPTLRSCSPLVGAALCRDGLRSSPGNLCREAEILGLLRSPSRHKAAPTGTA
ncbi:hypothetical protein D0O09_26555 [Pseudomonas putida]|nr:hypothetical protein D0O09_26555 [Pseudomonas putida]